MRHICLLSTLFSCCFSCCFLHAIVPPPFEIEAHKVSLKTAQELYSNFRVEPLAVGGGMVQGIQSMALTFRVKQSLSQNEARKLMINCIEAYLKNINASTSIASFLAEKPFSAKRLDLMFVVLDQNGNFFEGSSIANFYLDNGKIVYKTFDSREKKLQKVHEETYEEAKGRL